MLNAAKKSLPALSHSMATADMIIVATSTNTCKCKPDTNADIVSVAYKDVAKWEKHRGRIDGNG